MSQRRWLTFRVSLAALAGWLGLVALGSAQSIVADDDIRVELAEDRWGELRWADLLFVDGEAASTLGFDDFFDPSAWEFFLLENLILVADAGVSDVIVNVELAGLTLGGEDPSVRYLADSDDNSVAANHIWYENSILGTPTDWRMMQLTEAAGGTLNVDGPVNANHMFDIAETFWESEPIEPGEIVAIDHQSPDAVVRSSSAGQRTLLGVASTRPGFILGGGAFSLDELRATWGDEIALEYERLRPELEQRVFAELPEIRAAADRVASLSAFEAAVEQEIAERTALANEGDLVPRGPSSPERLVAAYETARYHHETQMFDRTLRHFFTERFSAVALAGRVPVKVDASFGAIEPGDFLTSSPVPGVAMKATEPGIVIGTALEQLEAGAGIIQVFVQRGWFGGGGSTLGGLRPASANTSAPLEREVEELRRRLADLEGRIALAAR